MILRTLWKNEQDVKVQGLFPPDKIIFGTSGLNTMGFFPGDYHGNVTGKLQLFVINVCEVQN